MAAFAGEPPQTPQPSTARAPPAPPSADAAADDGFIEFLGADDVGDAAWWEFFEEVGAAEGATLTRSAAGCEAMMRAAVLCAGLLAATANMSFAQSPPPPAEAAPAPRAWASLSPEQQHLLQNYQDKWNTLPADRQQSLAKGSQRWLSMTPEQRSNAQQRFSQWRAMPPEQRQVLRQRWQQFKSLPPEQQQRVRENFQRFRQMPPERRMELRRQWRQMSPEQRRNVIQHGPPPRH